MNPTLTFETITLPVAGMGRKNPLPELLGTLNVQNRQKFDLEETDEIYEGYGQRAGSYPYPQRCCYDRELHPRDIPAAVLENDALYAVFLPTQGGRLWRLTDKRTGRELLYTNDVLRYSNFAVCNAWFSGGVEWNIGVIGHTPFTTEPLYTAVLELPSGAPVLRMYELERVRGVTYQMDFWLEEHDSMLNCRMRIENTSPETVPMYWWSNIAVPEWENGRVAVPASEAFTSVGDGIGKVPIPLADGTDVSFYNRIPRPVDYFFHLPEDAPRYIAAVDADGVGLLQMSTARLRGRKLFSWGHTSGSDRWQHFLTEKAGPYLEIQAGLGKTQYGCIPMAPHTAWEWLEQYGPIRLTKEQTALPFAQFRDSVTELVCGRMGKTRPEELLRATSPMAKSRGKLVLAGSGFGALEQALRQYAGERPLPSHLEWREAEELSAWRQFFAGGPIPVQRPQAPMPMLCFSDLELSLLRQASGGEESWLVQYQLGLCWYIRGDDQRAREYLERSLRLCPSVWAEHALACVELRAGALLRAREHILRGMSYADGELCYFRDAFRILLRAEAPQCVVEHYETMEEPMRSDSRLRLLYLQALLEIGRSRQVLELLLANEGPVPDDLREGERTLVNLYMCAYKDAYGEEPKELPYIFDFRM